MSNHLFRIYPQPEQPADLAIRSIVLLSTAGIHATYAYSTGKTEEIHILQKYKMNRCRLYGGQKGRHFNVNNSLWKWDQARIQKSDSIKYYGWRKPIIGLFPNIIQTLTLTL